MTTDPLGFTPTRREPRGDFPEHTDTPRPVLTADEARQHARDRLNGWLAEHPGRTPGRPRYAE